MFITNNQIAQIRKKKKTCTMAFKFNILFSEFDNWQLEFDNWQLEFDNWQLEFEFTRASIFNPVYWCFIADF